MAKDQAHRAVEHLVHHNGDVICQFHDRAAEVSSGEIVVFVLDLRDPNATEIFDVMAQDTGINRKEFQRQLDDEIPTGFFAVPYPMACALVGVKSPSSRKSLESEPARPGFIRLAVYAQSSLWIIWMAR